MKPAAVREEEDSVGGSPMGVQVLAFLCGIVVAYLGFKSTWGDYSQVAKLGHLDRFVETPGKFLQVKVRRDSVGPENDFYPDVLYEYFVDGKSVWGWRLSYEEEPKPKAYWEARLAGYAQGGPVSVFYNAAQPKDAILEKKHDGLYRVWLKMALGAGFLLAGLVLVWLPLGGWLRKLSPKSRP